MQTINRAMIRCPQCRTYPVEYRVLEVTGDAYGFCTNYPECSYVTHLLEDATVPPTVAHSA
jgi:ssDNA-binding Zn-finger/Zn-ribbon topoisomerase 1